MPSENKPLRIRNGEDVELHDIKDMLTRVDERTRNLQTSFENIKEDFRQAATDRVERKEFDIIQKSIEDRLKAVEDGKVSKAEFDPVKAIVYGLVGIFLTSIAVGIVALVMKGV